MPTGRDLPGRAPVTLGGEASGRKRMVFDARASIFAFSPLARGFFSNYYDPANPADNPVSRWCTTCFGTEENIQRLERTRNLAREHGVTVAQVALAYVLRHPLHAFAVVGCRTIEKFADNVAALSLDVDETTLRWLTTGAASP